MQGNVEAVVARRARYRAGHQAIRIRNSPYNAVTGALRRRAFRLEVTVAEVEFKGDVLIIHVTGWDKVWALKSQLTIPIAHIVGAEPGADAAQRWWKGIRMPGTHLPGVIIAGTFFTEGGRVFWDVHDSERAVAISLRDDRYTEIVIEVADPSAVIARINRTAKH